MTRENPPYGGFSVLRAFLLYAVFTILDDYCIIVLVRWYIIINFKHMTRITKEQSEKYTEELINIIHRNGEDKNLLREFLKDLLTPSEYRDMGIRWQIVKRLVKHGKHREIASDLKIGIATVGRGSRELNDKNGGFWLMVKRLGKSL